ncbi:MAG: hypothetical protein NTY12_04075 [Candidatus Falkowbacteria bacterium]|nr:hypothetical protein [Candidatus Falkowbacteria bacterium]
MSFFDRLARRLELDDFDKRHRTAFVALGCVTVLILVLWFFQLNNNIIDPLYGGLNPNKLKQEASQTSVLSAVADNELKNKDTDSDGLSDYDEINIYKTSAYLSDSDSDGISDMQEIKNGTDPNCAAGKDCSAVSATQDSSTITNTVSPQTITNTVTPQTNTTTDLSAEEKNALKQILGSSNDPKVLREFLVASGAEQSYVDSLKDQDLQKVINEILK